MQGMRLLIIEDGKPTNHGIIAEQISADKYLCTFAKNPSFSRVCDIEEIQGWHLFMSDSLLNMFILSLQPKPATPAKPSKKKSKKKVAKKRGRT